MKRFGLLLFLFTFAIAPVQAHTPSAGAVEAFNQGVKQFNANQFAQAIPFFDKAIDKDATFAEAFYARAACKRNTQDPQGAISDLNQVIELDPNHLDAYAMRGAVWYEQEQWDPALQDFDHVLKARPRDAQALLGRGIIALKQKRLDAAQRDLRLFVKVKPDDPLTPRLRKLLASLARDTGPSADEEDETAAAPVPTRHAAGSRPVSQASEQLSQEFLESTHALSDNYNQKVLRGERAEAVGDIHAGRSIPAPEPSRQDIQIIDPH